MKYENNLHTFSERIISRMKKEKLVTKKGKPDVIALYNKLYPDDIITDELIKQDRQKVTDKTRSVSDWIKGKYYPRSIKDIMDLCNILNCSIDYLFDYNECSQHDIQSIHDETGLSEEAIKALKEWNKISIENGSEYNWARNSLQILNNLLAQKTTFSHNVLLPIADYIIYRSKYNIETFRAKDNLDKYRLALFTATDGLSECIKNIYSSENPTNGLSEYNSKTYFVKNPKKMTPPPKHP